MQETDSVDVEAHIKSLSRASGVLSDAEVEACRRACEVSKVVCKSSFRSVVNHHADRAILQCSSADGTPKETKYRKKFKLEEKGRVIEREGKRTSELFCMSRFMRVLGPNGSTCVTKACLRDPVPLQEHKKEDIFHLC